jgi:hypothetical protein
MMSLFVKFRTEEKMAEEKETLGQMNAGDASTNDSSSLSRQSTGGPRTPEGKERSKYNAVKHGIFSKVVVLKGEPRVTFDKLLNGLFSDLRPQGTLEEIIVEKLAILAWRYRRLLIAEAENSQGVNFLNEDRTRWKTDQLLRCEGNIERAFDRALSQFERFKRMRLGQPILPPIKLDISSA